MARHYDRECWYDLRETTLASLRQSGLFPPSVQLAGRMRRLDAGLNHENYVFWIKAAQPAKFPTDRGFVLRKLGRDARKTASRHRVDRLRREAAVLQALKSQDFEFAIPMFVCFVGHAPAAPEGLVETGVPGIPCLPGM